MPVGGRASKCPHHFFFVGTDRRCSDHYSHQRTSSPCRSKRRSRFRSSNISKPVLKPRRQVEEPQWKVQRPKKPTAPQSQTSRGQAPVPTNAPSWDRTRGAMKRRCGQVQTRQTFYCKKLRSGSGPLATVCEHDGSMAVMIMPFNFHRMKGKNHCSTCSACNCCLMRGHYQVHLKSKKHNRNLRAINVS